MTVSNHPLIKYFSAGVNFWYKEYKYQDKKYQVQVSSIRIFYLKTSKL